LRVQVLPPIRRDPIDRLLVAQSQADPPILLTANPAHASGGTAVTNMG
jgi:PIN domain nuclease of toxin-antitoxin system